MRRLTEFSCAGDTLGGTLDDAAGTTGLLIVSGGNEIRIGAHRGMAILALRLAQSGVPVFRFDRRGIGDSTGENRGFASSADDIAAAVAAFRAAAPHVTRIVGFGNCDAATALALYGEAAGVERLVLANPWLRGETDDLPAAAAIRSRYAERLRDPAQWLRLLCGGINIRKAVKGLTKSFAKPSQADDPIAARTIAAIARAQSAILLAQGDATAQAFRAACPVELTPLIDTADTASHSFARAGDQQWLFERVLAAIV